VAAAVAAALLTSSAQASGAPPAPHRGTALTSEELQKRAAVAVAGDDTPGETSQATQSASSGATTIDPKIIGGSTTTITTAPWMAQLWYADDRGTSTTSDDIGFFCGGAVIAPTKILTAAHCVKGYNWKANGWVVTGTSQLMGEDGDLHGGSAMGIWRQWHHPAYNPTTIDNDVAVLTLPNPIKATPIRMTTNTDTTSYVAGTKAKVYGWGRTSSTSQDISDTLKVAELPIQSNTTCTNYYGADYVQGHMVCAGEPATGSDTGTNSACNGDSGGPLVVNDRIVGVVSWGVKDCVESGAYSVFAKMSTYVGSAYPRVEDTNLNGDHPADLFVRNASTKTGYEIDSKVTSLAGRVSWGSFSAYNVILQSDLDRDGYQDFILRRTSDGDVFWRHFVPSTETWATKLIGDNWKTRLHIVAPGDMTGDYLADLLAVDSAGALWLYAGKGNGSFAAPLKVGTGFNNFNVVRGHGDFNGDGNADLLVRNKSTGAVYLYRSKGVASTAIWQPALKVATWTNTTYNAFDTVGDFNSDGKADLLARTPGGTLYLLKGTGSTTSAIFATRVSLGTGFQQYDLFG
jgi:hypothetical protein